MATITSVGRGEKESGFASDILIGVDLLSSSCICCSTVHVGALANSGGDCSGDITAPGALAGSIFYLISIYLCVGCHDNFGPGKNWSGRTNFGSQK